MAKEIRVVHKRPGCPAEVVDVKNTLRAFQALLDGGMLCGIYLNDEVSGYADDEGILKDLPLNFILHGEPIVGPAFFSKCDAEGEEIGFEDADEALRLCRLINDLAV